MDVVVSPYPVEYPVVDTGLYNTRHHPVDDILRRHHRYHTVS
jgi:hypothetical protein